MLLRTSRWCSTLSISSVTRPSSWSSYTSSCHAITLSSSRVPAEKSARSVNIWSQTGAVVSRSTSVCVRAPPASRTTNGSARNGTSLASLTVMSSGVTPDPMLIGHRRTRVRLHDLENWSGALSWRSSGPALAKRRYRRLPHLVAPHVMVTFAVRCVSTVQVPRRGNAEQLKIPVGLRKALMWPNLVGFCAGTARGDGQTQNRDSPSNGRG